MVSDRGHRGKLVGGNLACCVDSKGIVFSVCLDFVGVKSCLHVYPKNNAPVIWTHGGHNFITDEGVDLPMQVELDDTDAGLGLMTLVVCTQYGTVGFDLLLPI